MPGVRHGVDVVHVAALSAEQRFVLEAGDGLPDPGRALSRDTHGLYLTRSDEGSAPPPRLHHSGKPRRASSAVPSSKRDEQGGCEGIAGPEGVVGAFVSRSRALDVSLADGDRAARAKRDAGEAPAARKHLCRCLGGPPVSRRAAASFASTTDASCGIEVSRAASSAIQAAVARSSAAATVAGGKWPETRTASAPRSGRCSGVKRALAPRSARISPSTTSTVPVEATGSTATSARTPRSARSESRSRPAASSPIRPTAVASAPSSAAHVAAFSAEPPGSDAIRAE